MTDKAQYTYFISDFHFGIPNRDASLDRELLFISWLDEVKENAKAIYILGDLFDFWFEYKTVVPKGYVRLLGKLDEIAKQGIEVHLFKGNHDIWAFRYLHDEIGITLHREFEVIEIDNSKFLLAHGDGLGPGDYGYKFLKSIFENKFAQWLFRWLHPDIGTRLGLYFSRRSRLAKSPSILNKIRTEEEMRNEPAAIFAKKYLETNPEINHFIFGHTHFPINFMLNKNSSCTFLGDWVKHFSYTYFDGKELKHEIYKTNIIN